MQINLEDYDILNIDEITIENKKKTMYDIEVEDDNSFFISMNKKDNILVHNCDGDHIRGLLINIFDTYWPELLHLNFIYNFITPIVKVYDDKKFCKYFYNLNDWNKYRTENDIKKYHFKYFKGLGTIEPSEMKEFFKKIDKHLVRFHYDKNETKDLIDMLFNGKRADDRKDWLKTYNPLNLDNKIVSKQTYDKFINNEFIEFSMYNNIRNIQNSIDGFKPSQRKSFCTLIKKNIKGEIKVSSLSGAVIEIMAYHNGNTSIEDTIVGMSQDFVGVNNINLLSPKGQFGSRMKGGQDSASARYIFTKLNEVTNYIFRKEDDNILHHLNDDGAPIEPKYYVPIIPMVLVNGSFGLGSGYSSDVPMFNPIDLITYISNKIQNKKCKEISPYYRGFEGEIIHEKENGRYVTRGVFKKVNDNVIIISELPIGMWNDKYFEKLDKLVDNKKIKDYVKNCTDTIINIKLILTKENMDELMSDDNVYKKLNLETYISTENMHLFDSEGKIKKYKDQYDIIDDFYDVRIEYYKLRKIYQLDKINNDINIHRNRIKFLKLVIDGGVIINKRSRDLIEKDLEKYKLDRIEESYNYLLNMSILSFTKERLQDLKEEYDKLNDKFKLLEQTSESDIWLNELKELKNKLK